MVPFGAILVSIFLSHSHVSRVLGLASFSVELPQHLAQGSAKLVPRHLRSNSLGSPRALRALIVHGGAQPHERQHLQRALLFTSPTGESKVPSSATGSRQPEDFTQSLEDFALRFHRAVHP